MQVRAEQRSWRVVDRRSASLQKGTQIWVDHAAGVLQSDVHFVQSDDEPDSRSNCQTSGKGSEQANSDCEQADDDCVCVVMSVELCLCDYICVCVWLRLWDHVCLAVCVWLCLCVCVGVGMWQCHSDCVTVTLRLVECLWDCVPSIWVLMSWVYPVSCQVGLCSLLNIPCCPLWRPGRSHLAGEHVL